MLLDLHVHNLAVLSEASLAFGPGLNVLTGETGAGKSLLVDSLALLTGARATSELIRTGSDTLQVSGVFKPEGETWRSSLAASGIETEGEIVVRREINRAGRNRVFINDQPVTLRLLSELAPSLLRIHAQHEELTLADPELQRGLLDRSEGDRARPALERTASAYSDYKKVADRLTTLRGDQRARLERIDLLRFQAGEIDTARLESNEDVELRRERDRLRNSEAITRALGTSVAGLSDEDNAAVEKIHQALRDLREVAEWVPEAADAVGELDEIHIRLEEVVRSLRDGLSGVEANPARLDAVEARLSSIERLTLKYGATVDDILERRDRIAAELDGLELDDEARGELEAEAGRALDRYLKAALALSAERENWAAGLETRVHEELADLAMARAVFSVGLGRVENTTSPLLLGGKPVEFSPNGIDNVVFELTANPGEERQPLAKVASGGELSRVYLALQLAIRGPSDAGRPTLVFDEVDVGVGGAEAAALGQKLQRLSRAEQVLVVTHLPQVASFGDRHFKVSKTVEDGRTHMIVSGLDEEGRVAEVARMLAGREVTELSRSHARELISTAGRSR